MNYSITQNGKPLDKSKYTIDEKTKTFSSNEDDLVLDFHGLEGWTFNTGSDCTFKTGDYCTFNVNYNCTFNTGSDCTFGTGSNCTFKTGGDCSFDTEGGIFNIWHNFKHIKTQGYVSVNIFNKGVISRLPLELNFYDKDYIIYYNDLDEVTQQGELLYTEDRLKEEDFKMMLELKK